MNFIKIIITNIIIFIIILLLDLLSIGIICNNELGIND